MKQHQTIRYKDNGHLDSLHLQDFRIKKKESIRCSVAPPLTDLNNTTRSSECMKVILIHFSNKFLKTDLKNGPLLFAQIIKQNIYLHFVTGISDVQMQSWK